VLRDGRSIGQLRRIACAFSFRQSPEFFGRNIRTDSALESHGGLGDLGSYCIRFALWLMNWQLPLRVPVFAVGKFGGGVGGLRGQSIVLTTRLGAGASFRVGRLPWVAGSGNLASWVWRK